MKKLFVIPNALSPLEYHEHAFSEDIVSYLTTLYNRMPEHARLYCGNVSLATDVTPTNEEQIAALSKMQGPFFLVHYPAGPAVPVWYLVVAMIAAVAITYAMTPKIPNSSLRNSTATSPNNELSSRTNSPRTGSRIPDIYGQVRSTPDLVSLPYSIYENNKEVEYCVMCIGRGSHTIQDCLDGTTTVAQIDGSSVQVYAPNTSIYGNTIQYQVGDVITHRTLDIRKNNSVNGQTLASSNANTITGNQNIRFRTNGTIEASADSGIDFRKNFVGTLPLIIEMEPVDDPGSSASMAGALPSSSGTITFTDSTNTVWLNAKKVTFSSASWDLRDASGNFIRTINLAGTYNVSSKSVTGGPLSYNVSLTFANPTSVSADWALISGGVLTVRAVSCIVYSIVPLYDLAGTYSVTTIAEKSIILSNPVAVAPDWATIPSEGTPYLSPQLQQDREQTIGPFTLRDATCTKLILNFVCANGLYKDSGDNQVSETVSLLVSVAYRDPNTNELTGVVTTHPATIEGSAINKDSVAKTLFIEATSGYCDVSVKRTSKTDKNFRGTVVDEVKWRDLMQGKEFPQPNFGNVTMIRSRTVATNGALAVKERKLNLLVTRDLTVGGATKQAYYIIQDICTDPFIGNRPLNQVDLVGLSAAIADAQAYFETELATEFCYTFDKNNISFEETISAVCDAVFLQAYREGNVIRFRFEKDTTASTLLFNHRNKVPGSETRTARFGIENGYDNVVYKWVDPTDDAIASMQIKDSGGLVVNAKTVESIGVRNKRQAWIHANRIWNKLKYSSIVCEFDCTALGEMVTCGQRILVANNVMTKTQDGDIVGQVGLVVYTSQQNNLQDGVAYSIYLQLADGNVQTIGVSAVPGNTYALLLAQAPAIPLVIGDEMATKTKYILVPASESAALPFLVTQRDIGDANTWRITAMNYDSRYYQADKTLPPS